VNWRTGSEARISCLKRDFGWRRSLFDGIGGTQTWCGWGVLAHNSVKIALLADNAARTPVTPAPPRAARITPGTDPPHPHATSPNCSLTPGRPLLLSRPDGHHGPKRRAKRSQTDRGTGPHDPTDSTPDQTGPQSPGLFQVEVPRSKGKGSAEAPRLNLAS
jgi:hypothetical protein